VTLATIEENKMEMKSSNSTINFKKVILPALYEYFLVVLPVFLYVFMEALHKGMYFLVSSPEWAIASIFLCFQASSLYVKGLLHTGKKINGVFIGVLYLFVLVMIVSAILNANMAMDENGNTLASIMVRLLIIMISTFTFFVLVCSSKISNS